MLKAGGKETIEMLKANYEQSIEHWISADGSATRCNNPNTQKWRYEELRKLQGDYSVEHGWKGLRGNTKRTTGGHCRGFTTRLKNKRRSNIWTFHNNKNYT